MMKKQISAKGPQDCPPMQLDDFKACIKAINRAFLTATPIPKEFDTKVDAAFTADGKRLALAAFAHFSGDPNRSLSFVVRYKALMKLVLSQSVEEPSQGVLAIDEDKVVAATRAKLLPNGDFDLDDFALHQKVL